VDEDLSSVRSAGLEDDQQEVRADESGGTGSESFSTAKERQEAGRGADDEMTPRVVQGAILGGPTGESTVDSVPETANVAAEGAKVGDPGLNAEEKLDSVPETAAVREQIQDERTTTETPALDSSHIPLIDLVPLRHLLDDATSVRECQLLLSSVLSQWGVPSGAGGAGAPDPESRIAAWLLAGRDGPVGDVSVRKQEAAHGRGVSSEGTAVTETKTAGEHEGSEEVTIAGVIEDIRELAVAGIAKVF
jgi:hypothetical protein